jgi:hypothetical protein
MECRALAGVVDKPPQQGKLQRNDDAEKRFHHFFFAAFFLAFLAFFGFAILR